MNKGKANKLFGTAAAGKAPLIPGRHPNPLTFSEAEFNRITDDTSWIGDGLNHLLEEMQMEPEDEGVNGNQNAPIAGAPSLASKFESPQKDTPRPTSGHASSLAATVAIPTYSGGLDSDVIRQDSDDARGTEGARRPAYQHPVVTAVSRPPVQPAHLSSPPPSPPLPPPLPLLKPPKPLLPPQSLPTGPSSVVNVPAPLVTQGGVTVERSPQHVLGGETVPQPDGQASILSAPASARQAPWLEQQAHNPLLVKAINQSQPVNTVASSGSETLSQGNIPDSRIWRWIKSLFR